MNSLSKATLETSFSFEMEMEMKIDFLRYFMFLQFSGEMLLDVLVTYVKTRACLLPRLCFNAPHQITKHTEPPLIPHLKPNLFFSPMGIFLWFAFQSLFSGKSNEEKRFFEYAIKSTTSRKQILSEKHSVSFNCNISYGSCIIKQSA